MIQCKDCEYFELGLDGRRSFNCDPFVNVKEPECIAKWQLIRLDMLLASYQTMTQWQKQLSPLHDKIMKYMQREIQDLDESDKWKIDEPQDNPENEENKGFGVD